MINCPVILCLIIIIIIIPSRCCRWHGGAPVWACGIPLTVGDHTEPHGDSHLPVASAPQIKQPITELCHCSSQWVHSATSTSQAEFSTDITETPPAHVLACTDLLSVLLVYFVVDFYNFPHSIHLFTAGTILILTRCVCIFNSVFQSSITHKHITHNALLLFTLKQLIGKKTPPRSQQCIVGK